MPLIDMNTLTGVKTKEVTTLRRSLITEGALITVNSDKNFTFGSTEIIGKVYNINDAGRVVKHDKAGNIIDAHAAKTVDLTDYYILATTDDYIAEVNKIDKSELLSIQRRRIGNKLAHPLYVVPGKVYIFECRWEKTPFVAVMRVGDYTFERSTDNMELPVDAPKAKDKKDAIEHFTRVFKSLEADKKLNTALVDTTKPSNIEATIKKIPTDIFSFYNEAGDPIVADVNIDAIYPVD